MIIAVSLVIVDILRILYLSHSLALRLPLYFNNVVKGVYIYCNSNNNNNNNMNDAVVGI